jgi:hypothetical protein
VHVDVDGAWYHFVKDGPPPEPRPAGGWKPGGWDMKALADDLHSGGFKLGLYATAGFKAVYGYEERWAKVLFEEWGADEANIDHVRATDRQTDRQTDRSIVLSRLLSEAAREFPLLSLVSGIGFSLTGCLPACMHVRLSACLRFLCRCAMSLRARTHQAISTSRASTPTTTRSSPTTSSRPLSAGQLPLRRSTRHATCCSITAT